MQVISNFSLKKFGKTQKTGVSYSVLLLIDSYLGFSVRCYFFAKFCCFISTTKKFNCKNIFYLILYKFKKKRKKKKRTYFESNMQKNCTNRKKQTVIQCVLQNNTPLNWMCLSAFLGCLSQKQEPHQVSEPLPQAPLQVPFSQSLPPHPQPIR